MVIYGKQGRELKDRVKYIAQYKGKEMTGPEIRFTVLLCSCVELAYLCVREDEWIGVCVLGGGGRGQGSDMEAGGNAPAYVLFLHDGPASECDSGYQWSAQHQAVPRDGTAHVSFNSPCCIPSLTA